MTRRGTFRLPVALALLLAVTVTSVGGSISGASPATARPTVASLSPATGPVSGGTLVTITGTGFRDVTRVTFGETRAPFRADSATTLVTMSPPGEVGAVDVRVTTAAGRSEVVAAGRFTYFDPEGRIAFSRYVDGQVWIHTVRPDGRGVRRLRTGQAPEWSPNGKRIAFELWRHGGGIATMAADGSATKVLAAKGLAPSWSPDGKRIVYHVADTGRLHFVAASGGASTTFRSGAYPAWSPDGRFIAFVEFPQRGGAKLFRVRPDGSGVKKLAECSGYCSIEGASWAPDSSRLAYDVVRLDQVECGSVKVVSRVIDVSGSGSTSLPMPPCNKGRPTWSPAGTRLAITSTTGIHSVRPGAGGNSAILEIEHPEQLSWQALSG
jgi:Tol biopolymer transport system component